MNMKDKRVVEAGWEGNYLEILFRGSTTPLIWGYQTDRNGADNYSASGRSSLHRNRAFFLLLESYR